MNRIYPIVIYPIILAAGSSARFGSPKALARFGGSTAVEIAIEACGHLQAPVVVLGHRAAAVRQAIPGGVEMVVHRGWRRGQLSSLLAGLRRVPPGAPFLLYPVDHPLLTRAVVDRLVRAFAERRPGCGIVMPRFQGRVGHPVIFAAEIRSELQQARTAREVVYRVPERIQFVAVRTPTIWQDFDTLEEYERLKR